jgi:hypothetical protein
VEDDVFGLEVAVDDFALVHVVERAADLLEDDLGEFLGEFALALEEGVELSRAAQLLHEVDVLLVGEEGVELDDVGVAQETLDLYLPHQLHQQFGLHVALADALQSAHEPRPLVPSHKHLPELPRTQLLPQREIVDADAALLPRGGGGHGLAVGRLGQEDLGEDVVVRGGGGRNGGFGVFLEGLRVVNKITLGLLVEGGVAEGGVGLDGGVVGVRLQLLLLGGLALAEVEGVRLLLLGTLLALDNFGDLFELVFEALAVLLEGSLFFFF